MLAITIPVPGGPSALVSAEVADPEPAAGEILIEVAAAGLNRADVSQREGHYPPPPGASPLPGMEVSGVIRSLGHGVTDWSIGDRVCALLPGGGYAELAVAVASQTLPVPEHLDLVDAAGLPEALATVWSNVVMDSDLRAGDAFLVHGGSSGIGTMAIQLARALGCRVATTAGSAAKLAACELLGADILIDYRNEDFVERIREETDGRGVDVILDAIGGDYLERNVRALSRGGRLSIIGNQSNEASSINVGLLMRSWATVRGTTLRARPREEKDAIMASVRENAWPLVTAGTVVPVIDSRFALADASLAHERMESSAHIGKILLVP